MLMPTLARFMTRNPWTITRTATMAEAHRVMREHQIRHLPVMDGDRIVGIVSLRDLHLLPDVVEQMVAARIGSAVVLGGGGLVGIFTAVDALRALAEILRREAA